MQRIPEALKNLVDQLARLPGLGPKSAMRAAMMLLKWPETEVRRLGKGIYDLRDTLHLCGRCGGLSDSDPCPICADAGRDVSQLCVVAEWDSMLTLEEGNFYRGHYFILGGLLAPLDHRPAETLEIERLDDRLGEGEVREVILALGATAEAEATASFVREHVAARFPGVRVTRLAQGIPLGAEVKYMDRETLRQSLRYRQELQPGVGE
ncbi:MAG: recombination mediator RecR [Mailhella sp.]|nr:recombination mediator RecR [Mailhella sp.]